jgi:hypothetical protein
MESLWIVICRWFVLSREWPVHVQRGYSLSRFRKEGTDMDMNRVNSSSKRSAKDGTTVYLDLLAILLKYKETKYII